MLHDDDAMESGTGVHKHMALSTNSCSTSLLFTAIFMKRDGLVILSYDSRTARHLKIR